jgi:hypothetical protein
MKFNLKVRKGSALLVALLIMGILLAVSLALSVLIFREVSVTKGLLDSGRAYYLAESGVEMSLYKLNNNLPGWQTEGENLELGGGKVDFMVKNRCDSYPCFDPEEFQWDASINPGVFYDVLDLNESITIPLFVVDDGGEKKVKKFMVQFFTDFNPEQVLKIDKVDGEDVMMNVLRWKVFGIPERSNGELRTEAISGYAPLSNLTYRAEGEEGSATFSTNETHPSWFGTVGCGEDASVLGKFGINCVPYGDGAKEFDVERLEKLENTSDPSQIASLFVGVCGNDEAKEYYEYDENGWIETIHGCYKIETFINNHKLNYLSLTNLINPDLFKVDIKGDTSPKIYFRVQLFGNDDPNVSGEIPRSVADITSRGYSGDSRQSINVKMRKGGLMPVFHFVLYSTAE